MRLGYHAWRSVVLPHTGRLPVDISGCRQTFIIHKVKGAYIQYDTVIR